MNNQEFLDKASKAYYEGSPIISDELFDSLAEFYNYKAVGHYVEDGVRHYWPMLSLQKCFDLSKSPFPITEEVIKSPKLDGAAVAVYYVDGDFFMGLTRGDGKLGRDISSKLKMLLPDYVPFEGLTQITGEVVAQKSIENSRNFVSGSLGLKEDTEFATRANNNLLKFVAYDVKSTKHMFKSWSKDAIGSLESANIPTVLNFDYELYPTDGTVYRIDHTPTFLDMGVTSHHPRGAFALKEQKEGVITKLLDVEWQVGKSGIVSPVAILQPIEIGKAIVRRATLHNIEYIQELDLEIGCLIEVIRSGEIIPRVVGRVDVDFGEDIT